MALSAANPKKQGWLMAVAAACFAAGILIFVLGRPHAHVLPASGPQPAPNDGTAPAGRSSGAPADDPFGR